MVYRSEKTNRTILQLVPSEVSLVIAWAEKLYLVKRMIEGIGNVLFSSYIQTLDGKDAAVT